MDERGALAFYTYTYGHPPLAWVLIALWTWVRDLFGNGTYSLDEAREVYEPVQRAQVAALEAVRPGAAGKEVDAVAREMISEAGHGDHFGHGLGHGVGLEVHEGPRLATTSDDDLAEGNVVTVEPGVYLPGLFGVRIEDLVVVTGDGYRNLSGLPKGLRIVD